MRKFNQGRRDKEQCFSEESDQKIIIITGQYLAGDFLNYDVESVMNCFNAVFRNSSGQKGSSIK